MQVCFVQGKPTIAVRTCNTKTNWLYDTGAAVTVISKRLYDQLSPKPSLSPNPYHITGANQKPLKIKGLINLPIRVLDKKSDIQALVCPQLSGDAILGMDTIRQLGIALNPVTQEYFEVNSIQEFQGTITQTIRLEPLSVAVIKIKVPCDDGQELLLTNSTQIADCFIPEAVISARNGTAKIRIKNCATIDKILPAGTPILGLETIDGNACAIDQKQWDTVLSHKDTPLPAPLPTKDQPTFLKRLTINVPPLELGKYHRLFLRNHDVFSTNKEDLGRANNFEHNIKLKNKNPIYKKQFRIPEAHQKALHNKIDEWQKIGIIEPCFSRYNSPIFIVPKKDGSFRFVLDYRALNENSLEDRYTMKDVGECIGEIGRAGSTIFSTMDLTSGFWQLPLDAPSRPLTAFTCPGKGQYQYTVLSMGLKGGPGSFQRMMELAMKGVDKVLVYIDDLLAHSDTHAEHRRTLQLLFNRLRNVCLKLNPEKCEFGATNVSYLGFRLTPDGILPGTDKLKAVRDMAAPINVTQIRQFLGLCNYFRTHVRNFSTIAGPLNTLTSKNSGWKGGPLPPDAKLAFHQLKDALCSNPVMAYPRMDRPFHLIVDAATGGQDTKGGFGAILAQENNAGKMHAIAYASRSLKTHEKNYNPYLAEMNAAAWGIDHFDVYLRGRKFILHTDHKPLETLGTVHQKTLNRLQERMNMYDFELRYKKGIEMPADILSRKPVNNITISNSFLEHVASDPFCLQMENFLQQRPVSGPYQHIISKLGPYTTKENGLFKLTSEEKDLIILPHSLAPSIIDTAHGTLLTGHGGIDKTVARLRETYYWPSMIADVKQRLQECQRCQRALRSQPFSYPLQPLPLCLSPNQRLHVDLFGPLKTETGKAHVLCMTDACTKFVELAVVPNKEAETVAKAIVISWICRYGVPDQIFSDGGKEFCNRLLYEICNVLQISKNKTTPAHPQCNAQAEIVNKTIKKYLATMTDNSLKWKHLIPSLAFAYNTTKHNTTGRSPSEMLYGYQPRWILSDMDFTTDEDRELPELIRHMRITRLLANKQALEKTEEYKTQHDEKLQAKKENLIKIGHFVYLDKRTFLNENEKLADKWEGPYLVTKLFDNGAVDVIRNGRTIRINRNRLKPFVAMGDHAIPLPETIPDEFHPSPFEQEPQLAPNKSNEIETEHDILEEPLDPFISPPNVEDEIFKQTSETISPSTQRTKFGTHPMILRKRTAKNLNQIHDLSQKIKRSKLSTVEVNQLLIEKFVRHVNHLADNNLLDEWSLPKQVTGQPQKVQDHRRRKYLQSLPPPKRNTLLTGDPLFHFDPIAYEYLWMPGRPQLPPRIADLFDHLPDIPENPPGVLQPVQLPAIDPSPPRSPSPSTPPPHHSTPIQPGRPVPFEPNLEDTMEHPPPEVPVVRRRPPPLILPPPSPPTPAIQYLPEMGLQLSPRYAEEPHPFAQGFRFPISAPIVYVSEPPCPPVPQEDHSSVQPAFALRPPRFNFEPVPARVPDPIPLRQSLPEVPMVLDSPRLAIELDPHYLMPPTPMDTQPVADPSMSVSSGPDSIPMDVVSTRTPPMSITYRDPTADFMSVRYPDLPSMSTLSQELPSMSEDSTRYLEGPELNHFPLRGNLSFHQLAEAAGSQATNPNPQYHSPAFREFRDTDSFGLSDFRNPTTAPRFLQDYQRPFPFQWDNMTDDERARNARRTGVPLGGIPGMNLGPPVVLGPFPNATTVPRNVSLSTSPSLPGNGSLSTQPAVDSHQRPSLTHQLRHPQLPPTSYATVLRRPPIERGRLALPPPPRDPINLTIPRPAQPTLRRPHPLNVPALPAPQPTSSSSSSAPCPRQSENTSRTMRSPEQPSASCTTSIDAVFATPNCQSDDDGWKSIKPSSRGSWTSGTAPSLAALPNMEAPTDFPTTFGKAWSLPMPRRTTAPSSGRFCVNSIDSTWRRAPPTQPSVSSFGTFGITPISRGTSTPTLPGTAQPTPTLKRNRLERASFDLPSLGPTGFGLPVEENLCLERFVQPLTSTPIAFDGPPHSIFNGPPELMDSWTRGLLDVPPPPRPPPWFRPIDPPPPTIPRVTLWHRILAFLGHKRHLARVNRRRILLAMNRQQRKKMEYEIRQWEKRQRKGRDDEAGFV